MQDSLVPLLLAIVISILLASIVLGLSAFLGPKRPSVAKGQPFECGNEVDPPQGERFHVKFYLVAILFLVFDLETVFVYPWALAFAHLIQTQQMAQALQALLTLVLFLFTVAIGLAYAWRKGALDWAQQSSFARSSRLTVSATDREVPWKNISA